MDDPDFLLGGATSDATCPALKSDTGNLFGQKFCVIARLERRDRTDEAVLKAALDIVKESPALKPKGLVAFALGVVPKTADKIKQTLEALDSEGYESDECKVSLPSGSRRLRGALLIFGNISAQLQGLPHELKICQHLHNVSKCQRIWTCSKIFDLSNCFFFPRNRSAASRRHFSNR